MFDSMYHHTMKVQGPSSPHFMVYFIDMHADVGDEYGVPSCECTINKLEVKHDVADPDAEVKLSFIEHEREGMLMLSCQIHACMITW